MTFWSKWWRRGRLTKSETEIRQIHRISSEVVRIILSEVGEPVLLETLAKLKKNREEKGESDYTSLGDIWMAARERTEELMKKQRAEICH